MELRWGRAYGNIRLQRYHTTVHNLPGKYGHLREHEQNTARVGVAITGDNLRAVLLPSRRLLLLCWHLGLRRCAWLSIFDRARLVRLIVLALRRNLRLLFPLLRRG